MDSFLTFFNLFILKFVNVIYIVVFILQHVHSFSHLLKIPLLILNFACIKATYDFTL